jgi:DNA-3-methyladenine glycosylase II
MDARVKPGRDGNVVRFLHTDSDLAQALARLVDADPRLAGVLEKAGTVPLRRRAHGFPGLARVICGQQLSTASAGAIWSRLETAFDPFHPDALRRARADRLARLGLSAAKIKSIKAIARDIAEGRLDLDAVAASDADSAHAALVARHGIGPWTADIYLLFCLGHADAWPAGDLALQEAARIAFALDARPTAKEMTALAQGWRPYRGVVAHLLWAYYHAVKRRDGAPMTATTTSKAATPAARTKRNAKRKKAKRNGRTKRTKP